jgi:hypothetical protein
MGLYQKAIYYEADTNSLKKQTLDLWYLQQLKLGNSSPAAGDRYQIMRPDHQLGIDAFVAEAMRLSPNVTFTQALKLLACIQIMPKTGGNSRPVGRPGWFLTNTSSGLGPIPLAFCPNTGTISTNLLADVLLIALNLGLAIFKTVTY